jgi:protein-tyrosine phosphatase
MASDYRILFVCLGNICRSPCGEGVLRHKVTALGLGQKVFIESAGIGDWHAGELPDPRMRQHAAKRGYTLESRARQVKRRDFDDFDLILAMDRANVSGLQAIARIGSGSMDKVRLFCEFAHQRTEAEVPDPYYDGPQGFETVMDIIEDGCDGLITHIRQHL